MKTLVLGSAGMVGSAIMRRIPESVGIAKRDADLRDMSQAFNVIRKQQPDVIYIAAAKVGGIGANASYPVDFLRDNLLIQSNVMHAAHLCKVKRLVFLGSSCIYPGDCPQPMKPEYLMTGALESTNSAYAMAKLAGIEAVKAYRTQYEHEWFSVLPTNLYGSGDNYDLESSHVVAALIRKIVESTGDVTIWGTGSALREFMHVDDLADAVVYIERKGYNQHEPVNIGTGKEVSITALAEVIADICNYHGQFIYDSSKPDGTPRKLLDCSVLRMMGWTSQITLHDGLKDTIKQYRRMVRQC
jgi:GDP-L-fucose synthase